jgi:hypothetical protein
MLTAGLTYQGKEVPKGGRLDSLWQLVEESRLPSYRSCSRYTKGDEEMKKLALLAVVPAVFLVTLVPGAASAGKGGQPPIKVGPIIVDGQDDIGTCNNVWAEDSFDKFYTITVNLDGTYNVQVNYKDGTFVTLEGKSPGACESGVDNGNTVAAGVTGKTHQEYNGTVIGTLSGATCDATCVDTTTILNKLFATGWKWVVLSDGGHWTWTGHYEAGSNGVWFDTSVNWPDNDRGDITSP